jgi:hypothetical protein
MKNYGNSFTEKEFDPVGAERINVWDSVEEFYPVGAVLAVSDTYPEGTKIPAGTAVTMTKVGGEPTIGGTSPTGLTHEDAVMGNKFVTLTIVTRGRFLESRSEATLTETQKKNLAGRILFVKEA